MATRFAGDFMRTVDAAETTPSSAPAPSSTAADHLRAGAVVARPPGTEETRSRFKDLNPAQMPADFSISLDAYRRGGTDAFLDRAPAGLVHQKMQNFEGTYVNIIDYIVRITHRIWEEKDIGYIYDTYSHDCAVWDDYGLQYGRDKIVADTIQMNNAFPDIRIVADEVIWAGDDGAGFHTSHRTRIFGTNTGYSRYGAPTGRRVQFWCLANCVARDNEIFHEHVVYDTVALLQQLGFNPVDVARRVMEAGCENPLPANFAGSDPKRMRGQSKPASLTISKKPTEDPGGFARAALHTIWNRRNLSAIESVYSPHVLVQATAGRTYHGTGQLQSFVLSMLAMFPDLQLSVDDAYWMGNTAQGVLLAIRWSMTGTHSGPGRYGTPTGKNVNIWGISHWILDEKQVQKEWFMFNEFGLLLQLQSI
jgi:predicted ester cyclase